METFKMLLRSALFLGGVAVVFVAYTVVVALIERNFSPKYAKGHEQSPPAVVAAASNREAHARALLDSGQLVREQFALEVQSHVPPLNMGRTAGLLAGAAPQGGR